MNKEQFLASLRETLKNMPDDKKQDILYDYEEHFSIGLSEGKTEEEIAQSLGDPRVIGNTYRVEALLDQPKGGGDVNAVSVSRAVFASISLTFFNIVFVLGPFCALVGVLFGIWAVAVMFVINGLGVIVSLFGWPYVTQLIANPLLNDAFVLSLGIAIVAWGTLACIGMLAVTKCFFTWVAAYVKFNARIIRGEK